MGEIFWLVPAAMVVGGVAAAQLCIHLDRRSVLPRWLLENDWIYTGGPTGARTLLGTVASSAIGVAGTVFSITIAALSLAAGQMGPRLLRNFTHDRGNQFTLGAFLGTFSYALMVLRSIRTGDEGLFVPHLALTVSIVFAFVCVGTLVFFVGHMAGRINVDTVIELVSNDVHASIERLTTSEAQDEPSDDSWAVASPITDDRNGYVQQIDRQGLAAWAGEHRTIIKLVVRPGDYVFPYTPLALVKPPGEGVRDAVRGALSLGAQRVSEDDLGYAVRQLVEVAVRALSPGVNDPHTAMSAMDRLGAALCRLVDRHIISGVTRYDGKDALMTPSWTYDELADGMFVMIRQNAAGSPAVLLRMLEVLTCVAAAERNLGRAATLDRHARLVLQDGERTIATPGDREALQARFSRFTRVRKASIELTSL